MSNKYSVNPKLNLLMLEIEKSIWRICNSREECISELKRYKKTYSDEPDYCLAQHGRLLISPYQVRKLHAECGYASNRQSDKEVWQKYMEQVGYVVRVILQSAG